MLVVIFIFFSITYVDASTLQSTLNDFDPLLDIDVTVSISAIKALEKIDNHSDPDFFCQVFINEVE